VNTNFGYTGHYEHAVSGLTLTHYRAYNSALGRWLSRDPIGENGGINLCGYVANNPVNAVDPLGLWQFSVGGGLGYAAQLSVGHNGGRWNASLGLGVGIGLKAELDPHDNPKDLECDGLGVNIGIQAMADFNLAGMVSGGLGAKLETSADMGGNHQTGLSGTAEIGIGLPRSDLSVGIGGTGTINIQGNTKTGNLDSFTDYQTSGKYGLGGNIFAGANWGLSW